MTDPADGDPLERQTATGEADGPDGLLPLLDVLQARVERLERDNADWQRRYAAQELRIAELHAELNLVFTTRSWRITAPMRWVQESLWRWNSTFKLKVLLAARRFLPSPAKAVLVQLLGGAPVTLPPRLFGPPLPADDTQTRQISWDPHTPIISVVIPCFNYGEYVCDAIASVQRQELRDYEIIVVDDGSDDARTQAVLAAIHEPKTRVIQQPHQGLAQARNHGIELARGRYICCLDADDMLEPTYLEKAVSLLESNPGVAFAYPWVRLFGDQVGLWRTEPFDLQRLLRYNHVAVASVFGRDDWAAAGGFSAELEHGFEDWDFWLRLAELGKRGRLIPEALLLQRRHGKTMTHRAAAREQLLKYAIRSAHAELYTDPARVAQLQSTYLDRCVDQPFLNLARSDQYRGDVSASELLVMLPWLPAGGAEAVVYEVVKALQEERGIACTIVTSVPNEHEWHDRFHALTHRIYHLPNFLPPYAWESFVINLLQTRGIRKLLLSASEFGYTVLPSIKRSVPDLQVYNLLHNDSDLGYFRHSVQYDNDIETHIGVSRSIANKLEKVGGIDRQKIRVIYNGVDLEGKFNPDSIERKAMYDKFDIPMDAQVVAYIGRLSTEKQPLEFVRLAATLKDTRDARFVMVGDGVLRDDVAQAIRAAGLEQQLCWWRDVAPEEVPHVLAVTDVLVIPSSSEGFPMVMLEALAMQVPVVSYDVGEVRAAVTDGVNGWVVPAGDFQALSRHVAELLDQPSLRGHLRARARQSVRERGFTRAEMIQGYLAIIDGQRELRQEPLGQAADLRG